MQSEQEQWERILRQEGLSMDRGRAKNWVLYTDKTDIYQRGRDAADCSLPSALKKARKVRAVPVTSARKCAQCGQPFEARRDDAHLCSPACRKRQSRANVTNKSNPIVRGL